MIGLIPLDATRFASAKTNEKKPRPETTTTCGHLATCRGKNGFQYQAWSLECRVNQMSKHCQFSRSQSGLLLLPILWILSLTSIKIPPIPRHLSFFRYSPKTSIRPFHERCSICWPEWRRSSTHIRSHPGHITYFLAGISHLRELDIVIITREKEAHELLRWLSWIGFTEQRKMYRTFRLR